MAPLKIKTSNRAEWLEARRSVLTATDVARLYSGGPAAWSEVRKEKQGTTAPVSSPYFDWGHEREPELIAFARSMGLSVHGNEHLFVDGDFGATPDGISDCAKTLVECKTTGDMWTHTDLPHRYRVQIEWQLMVMGADRCLLVWEERLGAPPVFFPGAVDCAWMYPDLKLRAELVETARRFLDAQDSPDDVFPSLLSEYAARKATLDAAKTALAQVEEQIRAAAGDGEFSYASDLGRISLSIPKPRKTFDQKRFAADHGDLVEKYTVERPASKPTLRVTLARTKGDQ